MNEKKWVLVFEKTEIEVGLPTIWKDFRNEKHIITGGRPPQWEGSTGRVYTAEQMEYYPDVFGMKWIQVPVKVLSRLRSNLLDYDVQEGSALDILEGWNLALEDMAEAGVPDISLAWKAVQDELVFFLEKSKEKPIEKRKEKKTCTKKSKN